MQEQNTVAYSHSKSNNIVTNKTPRVVLSLSYSGQENKRR